MWITSADVIGYTASLLTESTAHLVGKEIRYTLYTQFTIVVRIFNFNRKGNRGRMVDYINVVLLVKCYVIDVDIS